MTQTKAELLQTRHQGDIRLGDADSTHYVGFKAPATVGTSLVWTLPAADGTANYLLKTDGSGNLGWVADSSTDSTKMPLAGGTFTGDVVFTGDAANVTWDKSTDDLIFNDNAKAIFGTGSDLSIYHDSNNSAINHNGTGDFYIQSNNNLYIRNFGGDNYIRAVEDGAVELYHDNFKSLQTNSNGVMVYAPEGSNADIHLYADEGDDNADKWRIRSSTNGDFKIGSYSSGSWVDNLTLVSSTSVLFSGKHLYLDGSAAVNEITETTANSGMVIGNTSMGNGGLAIINGVSGAGRIYFGDATGNNSGRNRGQINYYHSSDYMMFASAGTEALRLDNSQNATFASAIYGPVKTVSALELDLSTGNYFIKTISGNSTFTFANPAASGTVTAFTLELTHSSGTVTWPSSVKWNADTAPTLTTGKTHLFMFVTDDGGTRYRGCALVDYVN